MKTYPPFDIGLSSQVGQGQSTTSKQQHQQQVQLVVGWAADKRSSGYVIPIVCQAPDGDLPHTYDHHILRSDLLSSSSHTPKGTQHARTYRISSPLFAPKGRWGSYEYSNKYTLWQKPQGAKCVQRLDDSRRVQFTSRFAVRCVLHRCKSREIHC